MLKKKSNFGKVLRIVEKKMYLVGSIIADDGCWTRGEMDNGCACNYDSDCISGNCDGKNNWTL